MMDVTDWIALGTLAFTITVFVVSFHRYRKKTNDAISAQNEDISLRRARIENKIDNNSLKIIQLEKEMYEMRKTQKNEIGELKGEFKELIADYMKKNREDHHLIFGKLENAVKEIVKAATLIETHINNNH